jgi:hypothetical protein
LHLRGQRRRQLADLEASVHREEKGIVRVQLLRELARQLVELDELGDALLLLLKA